MQYNQSRKIVDKFCTADYSDIDWLYAEILGVNRSALKSNPKLDKKQHNKIIKLCKKLNKDMPLSIVLGYTDFCGNKILVNKYVLTPRFETEELVDYVIKDIIISKNALQGNYKIENNDTATIDNSSVASSKRILDLCCGSGAIAIAVSKSTGAKVDASDISNKALKVANRNIRLNKANVNTIKSDMFLNIWGLYDYIICNPPYIDYNDSRVQSNVKKWEPAMALYATDNGYSYYKLLAEQAKLFLAKNGKLCLEVGDGMANSVAELFKEYSSVKILKDNYNKDRMVIVTK